MFRIINMSLVQKLSFCLSVAICMALTAWAGAAAPVGEDEPLGFDQLASQLTHEKYAVRERATGELWRLGASALPQLRELTRSEDPEQAIRARRLVRKIEMGLFPDTDPELLGIVERYPDALPSEKTLMIRELQSRRAWRQMLKLHQEETNDSVRRQHLSTMQHIAVYAAREKLSMGENEEALELLQLAPRNSASLLTMAHFHRAAGSLEDELRKVRDMAGVEAAQWRVALNRAAGKIDRALADTDPMKDPEMAAALAALNGDPLPWLGLRSVDNDGKKSRQMSRLSQSIYARLAMDRWNNQVMNSADLATLTKMLENRSAQYRRMARCALFMLGEHETAQAALIKDSRIMGVYHLLTLERVEEALKLLGRSVDEPCSREWVGNRLKDLDEDALGDIEDAEGVQALYIMAGFLESRGQQELAYQCFSEPALEFADRDKTAFLNFLMKLINQPQSLLPAPELSIRLAVEWARDDDERWGSLTDAFWAGDDDSHEWWKLLGRIDPNASRAERLRVVMILTRRISGEQGERKKWVNLAWNYCQNCEGDDREDVLRRLVDLAFNTGDVELSQKVWPEIPEDMNSSYFWRQQISHLTARNDWDGACKVLLDQVEKMKRKKDGSINPAFHAYAASALRRTGRLKEARHHDHMADLLCLGDGSMAMQIAMAYGFGDDYERSRIWWERAAQSISPDSSAFAIAIAAYAESLIFEPSKRLLVASLNEVASSESIDSNYYELEIPLSNMRYRLKADTYRALSQMERDKQSSMNLLRNCHQRHVTDGVLADFFFPVLRQAGLRDQHDRMFDQSWKMFTAVLEHYPEAANTLNTASWFASRAHRQLEAAEKYQRTALKNFPEQAAYLDTMAEIQFAKGKRKEALGWSRKAIMNAPTDTELRKQYHHFRYDELPK